VTVTLDWLKANIPDADGPVVLVQGDTGPGNFLYADGRVTGIIDWELAHLGDPMDDIAWLSWRATQHDFPDFPERLREYERLSGITVDDDRVRYYRLNAFSRLGPWFGLADMGLDPRAARAMQGADGARSADGALMIMSMLHRRMRLEATSAALGLPVPSRDVDDAPAKDYSPMFDQVLDQLSAIAGESGERATATRAKAAARTVKHLRELDRSGDLLAMQEREDIARLLGRAAPDATEARRALVDAVRAQRVSFADYVDYHWRRLRRDDHLMRFASGAMFDRSWPPLR
jgi:prepilin-type processing-associated H-X9-DG protein